MALCKIFNLLLLSFFTVFSTIDRIQKALEKGEFEKAEELIAKGYEKEPDNPGISFYHAQMLFTTVYNGYNPDSARVIVDKAIAQYAQAPQELREEVIEEGITLEKIHQLEEQIRNFLFQATLDNISLQSIADFQSKYPNSAFADILDYKSDSIEFKQTLNENSEKGFEDFISTHPASVFTMVADSLLDGIRYRELVTNGSLKDYYSFLKKHPLTRWESQIESYILHISTSSHKADSYVNFIRFATTSQLRKKAGDLLFYVSPADALVNHLLKDSIETAHQLSKKTLFPVMDRDLFGFHSITNGLQVPYRYDEIQYHTKCATSEDDWLFVIEEGIGKIIDKRGEKIIDGVENYENLGEGLALVVSGKKNYLYHKSGFKIVSEPIENAEALNKTWIKIKKEGKWGLYTFLGIPIAESLYDDIYLLGSFWVFEKNGLLGVYTKNLILKEIEEKGLSLEFKFEDIELVDSTMLIGFRGERECLMDSEMNFLVPWGDYEIHPDPSGWYLRSRHGYKLYNNTDERVMDRNYSYLESNEGWLALKTVEDWILVPKQRLSPSRGYDSLKIVNPHAVITYEKDKTQLLFSNGNQLSLEAHQVRSFPNYSEYLMLSANGSVGIYNENGELVVDGKFDEVAFINDTLLRVTLSEKQGLLSLKGGYVLNPLFDSIDEKDGMVLTLLRGKIGCYDLEKKILISPKYETRITALGNNYLARKDGKYGIINANEDEVIGFHYDEIEVWSDSLFLVTKGAEKLVINSDEESITEPLEKLQLLLEEPDQKIYKYIKNGRFGLISNRLGILLEPEFTDIINIGDEKRPLFFADQNLASAGFHVVSYINGEGKLIFSKAYRKEEFERIICDD